jgi:glutamyl-Q tRNA(Asp) synthetase
LILQQLAAFGLLPTSRPGRKAQRGPAYAAALQDLLQRGLAYPCACTRKDIAVASAGGQGRPHARFGELVYPGTCRSGLHGRTARAVRLHAEGTVPGWTAAWARSSRTWARRWATSC